jgi:hypothetical protein
MVRAWKIAFAPLRAIKSSQSRKGAKAAFFYALNLGGIGVARCLDKNGIVRASGGLRRLGRTSFVSGFSLFFRRIEDYSAVIVTPPIHSPAVFHIYVVPNLVPKPYYVYYIEIIYLKSKKYGGSNCYHLPVN